MLENKLGITSSPELAVAEERISKKRAIGMFITGMLDSLEIGTFAALRKITNTFLRRSIPLPVK